MTEVYEGELIQFGGTDKIVKDGRPEQNPFAFVVHGVAALLDAARVAAAPSPTAQETQEAGPATEAGEALPDTVAAAPSLQQQQQQQQQQPGGSTIPAVQPVQQIPPQPQQPEQVAAGDDAAQPLEQPVLPPQLSPVAALQGPVDLTGTPQNARTRAPASGRVNEIVDLTVEVIFAACILHNVNVLHQHASFCFNFTSARWVSSYFVVSPCWWLNAQ